jgi:integrase
MATIYKRNKRKKNEPYSIQYLDHEGTRKTVMGFTDRGLTEQLAAKLETEARLRRTGLIDPEQEKSVERKLSPIEDHLTAFELSLGDNTDKHVKLTMFRTRRLIEGCAFTCLGDIDAEKVQTCLRQLCVAEDLGHRTYNHYLQAMDAFLNWCVPKRLLANPLAGLERLNQEVDIRHQRRALTPEEVGSLVGSARASGYSIQQFEGEQRARIYILSYMTGLRRKELGSLSPRSFDLKAEPPTVTVEAVASKHRRKDVLPLHPELVAMLRQWLKELEPGQKLFPKLERKKTWFMVKKDLERVGIPYETEEGIADFHAAGRHSHITELLRNGTSLSEAKELARHSDVKMTMKYAHIGITDQAKAVARLPAPRKAALHGRCISGGVRCHSPSSAGKTGDPEKSQNPCGDRGFGVECRHPANGGKVEAAGIEPASCANLTGSGCCLRKLPIPLRSRLAVLIVIFCRRLTLICNA